MRIAAGQHRGRRLAEIDGRDIRPTSDRARAAVFDILARGRLAATGWSIEGAVVLDAFCGTGALGLEALSQGAGFAVFMDTSPHALARTRENIRALGEAGRSLSLQADALAPPRPGPSLPGRAGLVFLDPPYGENLGPAALVALDRAGWVAPAVVAVFEMGAHDAFAPPEGFEIVDTRRYGAARICFTRRTG